MGRTMRLRNACCVTMATGAYIRCVLLKLADLLCWGISFLDGSIDE